MIRFFSKYMGKWYCDQLSYNIGTSLPQRFQIRTDPLKNRILNTVQLLNYSHPPILFCICNW